MENKERMTIQELNLPGVFLIKPDVFPDERGFFLETYNYEKFAKEVGIKTKFIQDNLSFSHAGVIRGLHFQKKPHAQAKLVRCVSGAIFDVIVDINPKSATFKKHVSIELSGENHLMVYIPETYAHGFCALQDSIVEYKVNAPYTPNLASGIRYDDPTLKIEWPCKKPLLSRQDKAWPLL